MSVSSITKGLFGPGNVHITRLGCTGTRHVLRERGGGDEVNGNLELRNGEGGGDDSRGTAHIAAHELHARTRLQADSSRVESDALADEREGSSVLVCGTLVNAITRD